jgi:murein DD-endopeptidase MepM/ murein hydrolase activator NlpD
MTKTLIRAALLALLTALIIIGLFGFRLLTAPQPMLGEDFAVVVGDRGAVALRAPGFAEDFNAALSTAKKIPFGQGQKVAVLLADQGPFVLSRTAEGLCVSRGWQNYLMSAHDAADLAIHPDLAPLYLDVYPRPLVVELEGRLWHVPPMSGEWEYLGIDGRFHPYTFGEMCPQAIRPTHEAEVTFRFEGAAEAPHVLFGDEFGELRDSATEGSFSLRQGQSITLTATPRYENAQFRGSLDFALSFEVVDQAKSPPADSVVPTQNLPPVADVPSITPQAAAPEQEIFSMSATETYPGEMLRLSVRDRTADEVSCQTDLGAVPRFFSSAEGAVALLPVRLSVEPGRYSITLSADGRSKTFAILVQPRDFVVQHLQVAPSTTEQTILSDKANAEYIEKIEPLKSMADSQMYATGRFILPVEGRITTEFGTQRYINGASTPSWHAAIDIGAATGTEVKAAHAGRVLFSEYIALTGNTILIEHGLGLKSWYYHMDSLNVAAGDRVAQGQVIGTVGSTGFSTGPHLHFGMSVGEYYVNPWSFID